MVRHIDWEHNISYEAACPNLRTSPVTKVKVMNNGIGLTTQTKFVLVVIRKEHCHFMAGKG